MITYIKEMTLSVKNAKKDYCLNHNCFLLQREHEQLCRGTKTLLHSSGADSFLLWVDSVVCTKILGREDWKAMEVLGCAK